MNEGTLQLAERQLVTDGLATFVSISLISHVGTMMMHFPGYLFHLLSEEKHEIQKDIEKKYQREVKDLQSVLKKLIKIRKLLVDDFFVSSVIILRLGKWYGAIAP